MGLELDLAAFLIVTVAAAPKSEDFDRSCEMAGTVYCSRGPGRKTCKSVSTHLTPGWPWDSRMTER